jgi:hypothetical protein
VATSIEAREHDVERAFQEVLSVVTGAADRTLHDVGAQYALDGTTSSEIGTRFGKVAFSRPVGRRIGWREQERSIRGQARAA